MKNWRRIWGVCLIILGCTAVLLSGTRLLSLELPDAAVRLAGVIDLLTLPVFAFASVRMWNEKKRY